MVSSKKINNNDKNKKNNKPKEKTIDELYGKGDIDDFIHKKSKIELSDIKNKKKQQPKKVEVLPVDVSEEEEEDFEEEDEYFDEDDFDGEGFDEDDGEDYDDDDDEEEEDPKLAKLKQKKKNADLDNKMSWGKEKDSFYHQDDDLEYAEDSMDEEEEEEEAKELHKQRSKMIKDDDYDDDEQFNKIVNKKVSKDKKSSGESSSEEKILQSMNKDLSSIDFGNNQDIEKIKKDLSHFTKREKLDYLENESPELIALMQEFRQKISEIKNTILPILQKVKDGQLPTNKGVSFLEAKYHLLLSYCLNISYYIMAKASGTSIKDHPVIDQLVKIRVMLEKIQPLDQKLQYQIEKLLKTAQTGKLSINKNDPLSFKPDLGSLGDNADGDDDDEETKLMNQAGLYQAPRISGNRLVRGEDDEGEEVRRQKKERRNKEKAVRSAMARHIEEEYGDAPEELADEMDEMEKEDDVDREQREYEEENLVRISQSKKDLKKKKPKKLSDGLDDIGDFGDLSSITADADDREERENKEYLKRKRMEQMMAQLGKTKRSKGEEEVELIEKVKKPKRVLPKQEEEDDIPSGEDEEEYDGIPRSEAQYYSEDTDIADGKRKIDYKMQKNRGLTRIRNREDRTPHLRYKRKFENAMKKVNASKSRAQRQDNNYRGTSRINPNAIHSTPYMH